MAISARLPKAVFASAYSVSRGADKALEKANAPTAAPRLHSASNYLHILINDLPLDVVGFRMDNGNRKQTAKDRTAYWEWFECTINAIRSTRPRVIAIGDFNLNPEKNRAFKHRFLKISPENGKFRGQVGICGAIGEIKAGWKNRRA